MLTCWWEEMLLIEDIGIDDNFFDLGGTSITAAQLILKINGLRKSPLPVTSIFEFPTIRDFAGIRCSGSRLNWFFA